MSKNDDSPWGGGKEGIGPKSVYMVSIMPCTAKKYEIGRDEYMSASGVQDTDKVLTTRELARMIQSADEHGVIRRSALTPLFAISARIGRVKLGAPAFPKRNELIACLGVAKSKTEVRL